jgi:ubiquinone/menaquinone biosynthesis C-methylase UbiE
VNPSAVLALYSQRSALYVRFVRILLYPQGLRAYFLRSASLASGMRVLDAGCGTGIVTMALRDAMLRRGLALGSFHAFDLTPAMLERFRETLRRDEIDRVELAEADVLHLDELPPIWNEHDLIVSASMLEYLPRAKLSDALRALRGRLADEGRLVVFITRRNCITRPLIGRWWKANLYTKPEIEKAFHEAGFSSIRFGRFPPAFRYLALWGYIVEAVGTRL